MQENYRPVTAAIIMKEQIIQQQNVLSDLLETILIFSMPYDPCYYQLDMYDE